MGPFNKMVRQDKKALVNGKRNSAARKTKRLDQSILYHVNALCKQPIKLLNAIIHQIHFNIFGGTLEPGLFPQGEGGVSNPQCSYKSFPPWDPQDL